MPARFLRLHPATKIFLQPSLFSFHDAYLGQNVVASYDGAQSISSSLFQNPPSHALILFQGSACSFYRQKDEMMDLMEMSSEIEDTLCRSYNVPDGIDENVLMGELDAPEADMETEIEAVIMLSYL